MGGMFERTGVLLMRNFRSSPFKNTDYWGVTQVVEIRMGRTRFRFDARNVKLLDVVE